MSSISLPPPQPPQAGKGTVQGMKGLGSALRPIARTSVISSLLWGAGDLMCQNLEIKRKRGKGVGQDFDHRRQATQISYAMCIMGPTSHIWYEQLDRVMLRFFPGGGARLIGAKVAADLAIFGPFHLAAFLLWTGIASGQPAHNVAQNIKKEMPPALVADTAFWAPVQIANFSLVPVAYQALIVNLACVADAAFLSYVANNPGAVGKILDRLRLGMPDGN